MSFTKPKLEIYRSFVASGGISGPDAANTTAVVFVPRDRQQQFLETFPGAIVSDGWSQLSVEQVSTVARALAARPDARSIAVTAEILQLNLARQAIEDGIKDYTGDDSPFAEDVIKILDSRGGEPPAENLRLEWIQQGVGGFSKFLFNRALAGNVFPVDGFERSGQRLQKLRIDESNFSRFCSESEADFYQFTRFTNRQREIEQHAAPAAPAP